MSNLVEHAKRELELSGQFKEDPAYSQSIVAAVAAFASYGHSGGSASIAVQQLRLLLQFKTLSPITGNPNEWTDCSVSSGIPLWQNVRDPSIFSEDGGKTWYCIEKRREE